MYSDGLIHFTPLVTSLAAWLRPSGVLWLLVGCDAVLAGCFVSLRRLSEPKLDSLARFIVPYVVLNPVLVLGCASGSLSALPRTAMLLSFASVLHGRCMLSAIAAALAVYCNPALVVLAVPLCMIASRQIKQLTPVAPCTPPTVLLGLLAARWIGALVATLAILLMSSKLITGSWDFTIHVYQWRVSFVELEPTVSMAWYFFAEILRFGRYYALVFQLFPLCFVAPLVVWFHSRPTVLFSVLFSICTCCVLCCHAIIWFF